MIEAFFYWLMQSIGYRKHYYDRALNLGIPLESFEGWVFDPSSRKGTYREGKKSFIYVGYGVHK